MRIRLVPIVLSFLMSASAYAADMNVSVMEVKDQRSTGQFFNNLEIKIKLIGDDAASVRGIRTIVTKAMDDTGRSLLLDEDRKEGFESIRGGGAGQADVTLKFKNPARRAVMVKEIEGELQLFMPDKDPGATVLVPGFMKAAGKTIDDPSLRKAGIAVTVLTKKEYEALKKDEEKKAKDAAEKQGLAQAMVSALSGLFGAFFQVGENDLIFRIADPSNNLIELSVVDQKGKEIKHQGSMKSTDLMVLNYSAAVPADAQLKISRKTERSLVTMPLRLTDVALP